MSILITNNLLQQLKPFYNGSICDMYFAVVARGQCSFSEKAFNVQNATPIGFQALIVANDAGKPLITMNGAEHADDVNIPSVMVSHGCSRSLLNQYSAANGCVCF